MATPAQRGATDLVPIEAATVLPKSPLGEVFGCVLVAAVTPSLATFSRATTFCYRV